MATRRTRWFTTLRRWLATLVVLCITAIAVALIWQYYVTAPWTRDGRVRVLVASVAPQVSGQIVELRMTDNQIVHKGDVLYVIDPFDFTVQVDSAKTQVKMRAADLQVKRTQAERRQMLSSAAASVEEKQQYVGNSTIAEAQFADAQVQLAQAEVNLKRTEVRSPVDGYVTNLQLRVGDYATKGSADVSVVDMHSFFVDGYFEETKLAHICVGDTARVELMGFAQPVIGRVESIGRGISVSNAAAGTQGLPSVDPVYTWVRLAQRVPVRVQIVSVPPEIPLASGLTATVRIHAPGADERFWPSFEAEKTRLLEFFRLRPPYARHCAEPDNTPATTITKLPIDTAEHPLSPSQINPGLTPALNEAPNGPADADAGIKAAR